MVSPPPTRRFTLAAVVVAVVVVLVWPGAVGAHSTLVESCPDRGEVVSTLRSIDMRFGSPLVVTDEQPPLISLSTGDGQTSVDIGPTEMPDEFTLTAPVPDDLVPGDYIARYLVLSRDGDLNDGGFQFTFDPEAARATNCGIDTGSGGGSGGLVLLAIGVVGLAGLVVLLRPRRGAGSDVAGSSP